MEDEYVPSAGVDLGWRSRPGPGLVTPRIVAAQDLDLSGLMAHLTDLVKRAKAGRLKAANYSRAASPSAASPTMGRTFCTA